MPNAVRPFIALPFATAIAVISVAAHGAAAADAPVADSVVAQQRAVLAQEAAKGFGPQSPRDIDSLEGTNRRLFAVAPPASEMTLCDIHFHKNAEHRGGDFTTYAGNGDGKGQGTGFKYNGTLTAAERAPVAMKVGSGAHSGLEPGDTIEVHFVHSTAAATLGKGLGTCLSDATGNPQLRVEAVVAVLVSSGGADFGQMARIEKMGEYNQVPNLPRNLGAPVTYLGSTTGPSYNEKGSPLQVTWSVRPRVVKVSIQSLAKWMADNPFMETDAHGVRNLVVNPALLSRID